MKYILRDPNVLSENCRRCGQNQETIDHIITGCAVVASADYTHRPTTQQKLFTEKYALIEDRIPLYKYELPPVS